MNRDPYHSMPEGDWLRPPVDAEGTVRYLETIRERWWLVALTTVLALLAAGVYLAVAPTRYQAEADLLVTAVPNNEVSYAGLGLITESNEPTQTISTAARLLASPGIANLAASELHLHESGLALLQHVAVEPIAQSNLLAILAESTSARGAQRYANGFAKAAIAYRASQLHEAIEAQLPALERRLRIQQGATAGGQNTLSQRVAELQALLAGPDPSVRVARAASLPTSPFSPRKKLALGAGLIGGLLVGLGAAFASQALDPRLRREEQLRRLFRLPILTWIPRVPVPRGEAGPLPSTMLMSGAIEAYRTLRATLTAAVGEGHRSILVTSSSASEGKTTTAINLAEALATAGHRVLLIEGDLRRPTIARALDIHPSVGIDAVILKDARMQDAIVHVPQYGENLGFLLAERTSPPLADRLSLPTARELVSEAESLADYVVIDSPPLTEVVDALPIAQEVDAVVIVARVNTSSLSRLTNLGNMLHQGGVKPAGIVVIGRERATDAPYYVGGTNVRPAPSEEPSGNGTALSLRRPAHSRRWS